MQSFELGAFLDEHLAEFKEEALEKNIDLTIITDFAAHIYLRANAVKIKSLLSTLLKNTMEHSGANRISFSIRQLLRSEKEILLEFSLGDNGCVARTKKFAYLKSLVIARGLIGELNGKSELALSADCGTVINFAISCSLQASAENMPSVNYFPFLKGKKILIVDDNDSNQKTITEVLSSAGIACKAATTGKSAIDLLEQNHSFDLILLDLLMPGMDGFETAIYIRKKLKCSIPIIAIPARDKSWIPLMCKDAGINAVLKKPFTAKKLLDLIIHTLGGVRTETLSVMKIA